MNNFMVMVAAEAEHMTTDEIEALNKADALAKEYKGKTVEVWMLLAHRYEPEKA